MGVVDVALSSSFYTVAMGVRRSRPAIPNALFDILGGDVGAGAALALRATALTIPPPTPLANKQLSYPFLTLAVSNLRTASRHAVRMGGAVVVVTGSAVRMGGAVVTGSGAVMGGAVAVVTGSGAVVAPAPKTEATLLDPAGRALRAVHRFRRAPIVSLTIGVRDAQAAAAFFVKALGARQLTSVEGVSEALLRSEGGATTAALAWGEEHNTTLLVLEQTCLHPETPAAAHNDDDAPTLSVIVSDVGAARAAFTAAQLPVADDTAGGGFIALCADGYAFKVLPNLT